MVLEEAIVQTFRMMGLSVLTQPKKLLSSVLDLCDEQTMEFKVFKGNCDDGLCAPFASVVGMPSPQTRDLAIAQQHAEQYLCDDRMISADAARETVRCLARAVGRALGLPVAELESLFGAQDAISSAAQQTHNTVAAPAAAFQAPQSDSMPYAAHTASVPIANNQGAPAPAQPVAPVPQKRSALPFVLVGTIAVIGVLVFILVGRPGVMGAGQSSSAVVGSQVTSGTQGQTTGAATVAVPATTGLTLESARVNIESAGLKVQVEEEESDATPQTVLRSDPAEGSAVQEGTLVTLVVAIAPTVSEPAPAPDLTPSEQPAASQNQSSTPSAASGPATFSSTSTMDDVWDFIPYYDHTPQTVHDWMLKNGFWLEGYSSECAVYESQYGTQFVFGQYQDDPAIYPGYSKASSNDQSPLLNGMTWSIMRVHFWGEGLDYAIDKCHLGGETWRGVVENMPTISSAFLLAPWGSSAAAGNSGSYMWEATYDAGSSFCTVVVRVE